MADLPRDDGLNTGGHERRVGEAAPPTLAQGGTVQGRLLLQRAAGRTCTRRPVHACPASRASGRPDPHADPCAVGADRECFSFGFGVGSRPLDLRTFSYTAPSAGNAEATYRAGSCRQASSSVSTSPAGCVDAILSNAVPSPAPEMNLDGSLNTKIESGDT